MVSVGPGDSRLESAGDPPRLFAAGRDQHIGDQLRGEEERRDHEDRGEAREQLAEEGEEVESIHPPRLGSDAAPSWYAGGSGGARRLR